MAFILWLDRKKDLSIDLGPAYVLLRAFAEMACACGDADKYYLELFDVTTANEEEVAEEWMAQVSIQACEFHDEYGGGLGDESLVILRQLARGGLDRRWADRSRN